MGKIIERVRERAKADKAEGCVVLGLNVRQVAYIKAKHAQETGEAVPPGLKGLLTIRFWWMKQGRRFPTQQVTKEIMGEHELDMAWAKDAFVVAMLDCKFPPVYPFVPGSWVTPEACDAIAKKQLEAEQFTSEEMDRESARWLAKQQGVGKPMSCPPAEEDDPRPQLLQQLARLVGLR